MARGRRQRMARTRPRGILRGHDARGVSGRHRGDHNGTHKPRSHPPRGKCRNRSPRISGQGNQSDQQARGSCRAGFALARPELRALSSDGIHHRIRTSQWLDPQESRYGSAVQRVIHRPRLPTSHPAGVGASQRQPFFLCPDQLPALGQAVCRRLRGKFKHG